MRIVASQENQDDFVNEILIKAADYIDSLENIRLALVDVIDNLKPLVPKMELKDGKILSQNLEELKVFAGTIYFLEKVEVKDEKKDAGNRFNRIFDAVLNGKSGISGDGQTELDKPDNV